MNTESHQRPFLVGKLLYMPMNLQDRMTANGRRYVFNFRDILNDCVAYFPSKLR